MSIIPSVPSVSLSTATESSNIENNNDDSSNINSIEQPTSFKHLITLKELLDNGFITTDEYIIRKQQLINQLTGTTNNVFQQQSNHNDKHNNNNNNNHSNHNNNNGLHQHSKTSNNNNNGNNSQYNQDNHGLSPPNYQQYLNIHDTSKPPQYNHTETNKGNTTQVGTTIVQPHAPPDFNSIQPETATKYTYDLKNARWYTSQIVVKIDTIPFAHGALRLVYHLQDVTNVCATTVNNDTMYDDDNNNNDNTLTVVDDTTITNHNQQQNNKSTHTHDNDDVTYVAKISMDIRDHINTDIYFRDVETQYLARYYAKLYNQHNPPKHIEFIKAFILRLDERLNTPYCAVEKFISGVYKKHSNNYGYVAADDRHTPEAYSHFTYESSQHKILVCDIQGVADMYTDPQIHSVDRKGFGKGNLGQRGIDKFLATHRCNPICKYLKLPPINANYNTDYGTLPCNGEYMEFESIKIVNIAQFPRIGEGRRNHDQHIYHRNSALAPLIQNKKQYDQYILEDRQWWCMQYCCNIM